MKWCVLSAILLGCTPPGDAQKEFDQQLQACERHAGTGKCWRMQYQHCLEKFVYSSTTQLRCENMIPLDQRQRSAKAAD